MAADCRRAGVAAAAIATLLSSCARTTSPEHVKAESVRAGDTHVAAGRFAEAATAYARAVTVEPQDGQLRLKLARALEQAQQWGPAGQEAMRAADLLPGNYDAGLLAARLVLAQSRFDDSLALSGSLLRTHPDDIDVLVLWSTATAGLTSPYWGLYRLGPTGGRGEAYDRACTTLRPKVAPDRDAAAERVLRQVLSRTPGHFESRFALAGLLWATRRADESELLIRDLADDFPDHVMINDAVGRFYLARGQLTLGEHYLERAAASAGAESRAPRLALADHYLRGNRFAEVLTLLRAETDAGDDAVVSMQRARALLGLTRHTEAAQLLEAILGRQPNHAEALALKTTVLLDAGDVRAAVAAGERAVRADPASAQARFVLARAVEALDDLDLAYKEYGEGFRLDPTAVGVPAILARLALQAGLHRPAIAHARQALERDPADVDTTLVLVEALLRAGEPAAAESALAPLRGLVPAPIQVQVLDASLLASRGRLAEARAQAEAVVARAPESIEAITALVNLDMEAGALTTSRQRAEAAVAARPTSPALVRLLGRAQRAEGRLTEAEASFRRALGLRPTDTDAALLLAECLAQQRRVEEARRALDAVLTRRPASSVARTLMARVLEALGRLDDAEAAYQSVLVEYPDAVEAAAGLAVLHITRGRDPSLALSLLREARRVAPNDAAVNDAYGWVQLHRDQPSIAIQALLAATRQRPNDATYHYHLGVALRRSGRLDAARTTLRRALALEPNFPQWRQAEAELARLPR